MNEDKTEGEDLDSTETVRPQSPILPEQVGPYRILERLGEGGMGVVYLAEQTEPVRRKVALKIIKHGMDTKQVVARFEAERQALAMMDHPCVAKVFDAGWTEGGGPYFAMEHVQGVPITEHCDRQRLTTHERLELFQQVCEGVQHAHQKAIIHRDLKPSNVLVSYRDGKATPKIIDFGVAKAIEHRLTEKTLFTEMGVLIGTPEYMSPEQAEMTGQNVDTRTDVYSLGVMLYELLVGVLPFDPRELRQAGFDEIRRKIREEEPSKPSKRLTSLGGERSTESARRRKTDPSTLRRQLSGDLDWITMHSLEKDRTRRYGSPIELSAEIRRYLLDLPIEAGPPSSWYRMTKFFRRHRAAAIAGGLTLLALLLGVIGTSWQAVRAIEAERSARTTARLSQRALTVYFSSLLLGSDKFTDQLRFDAYALWANGEYAQAKNLLEKSLNEVEKVLAGEHPFAAALYFDLAALAALEGDHAEAIRLLREANARDLRVQDIAGDPDFASIRADAEFKALAAEVTQRASQQHLRESPPPGTPSVAGLHVPIPTLITKVEPTYPEPARDARTEGSVLMEILIRGDGSVGEVAVLRCDRPGMGFEKAASEAVNRWRYYPIKKDGVEVDVKMMVMVEFTLEDTDP